ncbi:MAG: AAA family ATPase [Candidatus Pseudobacter hemicellulosilyticus]|uniref:AAA family ATPase n=1 Tax=Candidatus Pseudobacter hemicellulosilyticus TaxID=3121375 RepID=A0AAJ5WX70_9BACT|nr:MAG: AAA family ATPase [Pseudobacter sp.]
MATIIIENLKNIKHLEFKIPPRGVHVLTGANGSGKTTLLACLERLAHSNAFPNHFKTSAANRFDDFSAARIKYHHNNKEVCYRYSNTRWSPIPRANADVLSNMGFAETFHLTSSSERFYVQTSTLPDRIRPATPFIQESMNEIFQTQKFDDLRRIKLPGKGLGEGRSNYGFLLPAGNRQYYTEKNFSLGEILVLNALHTLQHIRNNSLLLIDEIELALHPRVQIRFFDFLERLSSQKQLTIILSTHSSSLIKKAKKLIHLEKISTGEVIVHEKALPAFVLKEVAFSEDFVPDIICCVEDHQAAHLLKALIDRFFVLVPNRNRPDFSIMPVGGWREVISFRHRIINTLFHISVRKIAVPDQDAEDDIQALRNKAVRQASEQDLLNTINALGSDFCVLPCTPELGLHQFFGDRNRNFDQFFQTKFNAGHLSFSQIVAAEHQANGANRSSKPRDAAKAWNYHICMSIQTVTGLHPDIVQRYMYEIYVEQFFTGAHQNTLTQFVGSLLV